jgi:UDP-N-acetylmuramoyl-L-alanyl-D-glutamate--2,6-diaminopimelate ligase
MVTLRELAAELGGELRGAGADRSLRDVQIDSRTVAHGDLFAALPGASADGARFVAQALERGALAVLSPAPLDLPQEVANWVHPHARAIAGEAAARLQGRPAREMFVVAVTGTNGKTTTAHLAGQLLAACGRKPAVLGTAGNRLADGVLLPATHTTPDAPGLQRLLARHRELGGDAVALEASSHALDQDRLAGLKVNAAVFTNLTRDHLDYHETLERYFDVKARLFTGGIGPVPPVSVVNLDDAYGTQLAARLTADVPATRVVTFGENPAAQVRAENVALHFKNSTFRLVWPGGALDVDSPLIGRYNVSNLLAAIAAAWGLGRDPVVFLARLRAFKGVPGRMERIEEGQAFNVLVDYAHTDDALRNALGMLRRITPGRLLVVFGCGGNRDRTKRPLMTRAVQEFADFAVATADNPRTEAIARIFEDMSGGVTAPEKISWIEDRRRAISLALDLAKPGDCVLIAGKGHECYQEFADTVFPFDDRQVVRELIGLKAHQLPV